MTSQDDLKKIKEAISEFFQKMTIEADFELSELLPEGGKVPVVSVYLETEEPQILIGERGQTLAEIQHLLKLILKRKIEEPFFVDLDINEYKKKKKEYLKEMAKTLADEAALTKKEKWLSPMSAYERRIIHLELAERKDVVTESVGDEPERRLVIKPSPDSGD